MEDYTQLAMVIYEKLIWDKSCAFWLGRQKVVLTREDSMTCIEAALPLYKCTIVIA